jgi:hypothetical protein
VGDAIAKSMKQKNLRATPASQSITLVLYLRGRRHIFEDDAMAQRVTPRGQRMTPELRVDA